MNHKIEGFFETCQARGMRAENGVIIPRANVVNLMLDDAVVDAVAQGRFHVWAVETVEQGIELLTGVPAGRARRDGTYPEGTIHAAVAGRLREYAEAVASFQEGVSAVAGGSRPGPGV